MTRARSTVAHRRRHASVLKLAKGYRGARSRTFKVAKQAVIKAGQYAYRDRKVRKRDFRRLWITRINAACREHGINYSRFMHALEAANITLNRKMLSELAIRDPNAFKQIVNIASRFSQQAS